MPKPVFDDLLHYLRVICKAPGASDLTDAEMLTRFLVHGEEAAFTLLVQRHGPMVLGVCRRVLGDTHSAEDSFQATFMVLMRRAASLRCTGSLGNWLYAVAQRIASKARSQTTTRRRRSRRSTAAKRWWPPERRCRPAWRWSG
jgi:polysaccharide export outer membrane protein